MTTFLFHFHSGLRWILVLGLLFSMIRYAMIWLGGSSFRPHDKTLSTVVTSLFDIQLLIGLVLLYLMSNGFSSFLRHQMEHAVTMFLAIVAIHLPARWKKSPDPVRARMSFVMFVVASILVFVAVLRLPQGWGM